MRSSVSGACGVNCKFPLHLESQHQNFAPTRPGQQFRGALDFSCWLVDVESARNMEYAFMMSRDVWACKRSEELLMVPSAKSAGSVFNIAKMCLVTHYHSSVSASRWRNRHASTRVENVSPTPRESRATASAPPRPLLGRQVRGVVPQALLKHGNAGGTSIAAELDALPSARCGVKFSLEPSRPVPRGLAVPTPGPMTMSTTRATPCCSCLPTP